MDSPVDFTGILTDVAIDTAALLWWGIPLVVLAAIVRLPAVKGWFGELSVKAIAAVCLSARTYRSFHDVVLTTGNGTTQIDHVFVAPYGIFAVETKNMKGWIFGAEHQAQWTQKIFRRSYRFQNPLRQNYGHTQTLKDLFGVPENTIHSVIAFVGDCKIKTKMPENVVRGGQYIRYIKGFRERIFTDSEVEDLCKRISEGRLENSSATRRQHIQHVKQRTTTPREQQCSKCGAEMVLRQARRGDSAGKQFWGCSRYPACRFSKAAIGG